ncbi:MAG: hypothetical protein KIS78_19055 [Labilithrix sp.]|nr:hypothetical protein [Labilithrix sp.]
MTPAAVLRAAGAAAQAIVAATAGRPVDAARHALDAALALVPHEAAAKLLSEQAIARQNAIADAAELGKFGGR